MTSPTPREGTTAANILRLARSGAFQHGQEGQVAVRAGTSAEYVREVLTKHNAPLPGGPNATSAPVPGFVGCLPGGDPDEEFGDDDDAQPACAHENTDTLTEDEAEGRVLYTFCLDCDADLRSELLEDEDHELCEHDKVNGESNDDGTWLLEWCERCGEDLDGEPIVVASDGERVPESCLARYEDGLTGP